MNILVTGGAGFIGTNLVKELLSRGNSVVVVDNLHTGSFHNLKGLDATLRVGDSKDVAGLKSPYPDLIYHLGMYSSSPMYLRDRGLVGEVLEGAAGVFDYALNSGARVVFASSSSIYNGWQPPHEESMAPKVMDFYTEARYGVERLAALYRDLYGMRYAGMRFFSVYGPHEEHKGKYANLVTQFVWKVRKGEEPVMRGDGSPRRDFVHVEDVVEALLLAAKSNEDGVFNVGAGKSYSLNEAVETIGDVLGREVRAVHLPEKGESGLAPGMPEIGKHYMMETRADVTKSRDLLGFRAKVDLEEGVGRLLNGA